MPDGDHDAGKEHQADAEGDLEPEHHGHLGGGIPDVEEALQVGLQDAGDAENQPQHEHGDGGDPETPPAHGVVVLVDPLQARHGEVEDGQVQKAVGAEEGEMPVRDGDLAAMGVVVDGGEACAPPIAPTEGCLAKRDVNRWG